MKVDSNSFQQEQYANLCDKKRNPKTEEEGGNAGVLWKVFERRSEEVRTERRWDKQQGQEQGNTYLQVIMEPSSWRGTR